MSAKSLDLTPPPDSTEPAVSILMVDDIEANLLALEAVLSPMRYHLVKTTSARQAIGELSQRDYAAVLLDIRMPETDGYELARQLRLGRRNQDVPILFLTAEGSDDDLVRAFRLGAADFLRKPLHPDLVRGKVRIFVELFRQRVALQRQQAKELARANERLLEAEREAEALRLRSEHDLLRALVQDSGDGIILADTTGVIRTFNPAAQVQHGVSASEVRAENWSQTFGLLRMDGRALDLENTPLYQALHGQRIEGARWQVRRPDGTIRVLSGTASPISGADGQRLGAVLITRDETDRLQSEEELREHNRVLALIAAVGSALGRDSSLDAMLDVCVRAIVQHLSAASARVWILDDRERSLALRAVAGSRTNADGLHASVPLGELRIGNIAAANTAHVTNVAENVLYDDEHWMARDGISAFAGFPLAVGDRVLGVLGAFASHPLSAAAVEALASIAGTIAQGVERQQAIEQLRASESWLSTTITSIGDGVIATDPNGDVIFQNAVASELTGWPPAEARGKPLASVFRIINEDTRDGIESPVSKVLREGTVVGLANHTLLVRRDGSEIPIEDSAAPIRDRFGALLGVVLVFRDGSERRAAELERAQRYEQEQRARKEAEAARQRLHSLFMQAPAAVCILTGPEHRFELANPLYLRLIRRTHIVGKTVREALPEVAGQSFTNILDKVYATGERFEGKELPVELDAEGRGPATVLMNFVYEPFRDLDGEVAGIVVIAFDVTELVKLRERIDAARQRAEQSNLEQQAARAEADHLRKVAEQANAAKDQFFATISHELRTPLTSILGWARIMKVRPELQDKALETIERNAKAQAQLIEDMLDSARIASGKFSITLSPTFVPAAVEAAIDNVRPAASTKGVILDTDIDPDVGTLVADAHRLQQVIWNLVTNAVKFTPKNGLVRVAARRVESTVEITVADTGKGIPPDFLPHVFERFRQAENASSGGLGLGLSIVRSIVELHGGQVSVDSEGIGKGARFVVRIPVRAALPRSEADIAAASVPRVLENVRLFVLDDEPDAREVVAAILQEAGAIVETAASVDEALAVLLTCEVEAVVTDIGMPEKDGYAFIREFRSSRVHPNPRLPVIALTAFARSEDRSRALTAGFTSHVSKPVEPTELVLVVANALGRELTPV